MKKIAVLTTGGTIASQKDDQSGMQMSGKITGEDLLRESGIDARALGIELEVHSVFQLSSNRMGFNECEVLIERMNELREKQRVEGFVITHGTDTMEETAFYLSLRWPHDEPVAITGSQIAPEYRNTDAFHNLQTAMIVAAADESKGRGVQLVFNDKIFDPRFVTKIHSSNIDGFGSPETGPLGLVDGDRVQYYQEAKPRKFMDIPKDAPEKKVEIVTSYVDMNARIIDFWREQGVDGLVVEGFGRGQVTVEVANKLKQVIEKGMAVVITTICPGGRVAPVYGYEASFGDLLKSGAINGGDYYKKKARTLLYLALRSGVFDPNQLQQAFS